MLIGAMIGHIVQDELEATLVRLLKQGVQVCQGSEERMHIAVIANIITEIGHGRRVDGRKPDGINTEPAQIVQLAADTREVSYPISIAIEKTPRVNLINHARLPPGVWMRHWVFCSSSRRLFL